MVSLKNYLFLLLYFVFSFIFVPNINAEERYAELVYPEKLGITHLSLVEVNTDGRFILFKTR